MWVESTGTSGVAYRLTTKTKNAGDALRTEYVVHRVTSNSELIWGHYFNDLDSATRYWIKKLRGH